jgi:hypothetical protein
MDADKNKKQSKYLFWAMSIFGLLLIISSYYNFFIKNNYEVTKQVPCDPKLNSCFVSDCASNDSTCDSKTTYMKITAPSKYAGSDYDGFSCVSGDLHCQIITCSADTVQDGEKCFQ